MTIRQKQCILAYFGDYTGQLDGKWGPYPGRPLSLFKPAWA